MAATIITIEDLQSFKQDLLTEIQKILSQRQTTLARKWLKSNEVRWIFHYDHQKLFRRSDWIPTLNPLNAIV
jgi:hypothetical protein